MGKPISSDDEENSGASSEASGGASVPGYYNDLGASLAQVWSLLERGAADRRSPFHTPVIATVSPEGEPAVRVMVLRGVDRAARTLRVHTDVRSQKLAHLRAQSRAGVIVYDARAKIQVRLSALATIHTQDAVAGAGWAASRPQSRLCYEQDVAPGLPIAHPLDAPPPDRRFAEGDVGEANFAVVLLQVDHVEWLYLAVAGHRRASWCWDGADWKGSWLAP